MAVMTAQFLTLFRQKYEMTMIAGVHQRVPLLSMNPREGSMVWSLVTTACRGHRLYHNQCRSELGLQSMVAAISLQAAATIVDV
jgi:hypothetical protein